MSKIFRLYKEGTSTYQDWNNSPAFPYNSTSRDTIEDPNGASARHEITSIPSPFARVDLIKNAFKEVCKADKRTKKVDLDGNSIFHKMVSDTLDVAEIFFNIDKFKGKVEIIKWDPKLMLEELENSTTNGHRYLADALRKYMTSDKIYNFDRMQDLYLLNYIQGPDELNIIGATSPATLFFSNANDLSYVNDIYFGDDKPFDSEYQPLYKRDPELIKYLFALRKEFDSFADLFPEFDAYLTATYRAITNQSLKDELNRISRADLNRFSEISVEELQQKNYVEVLGTNLRQKSSKPVNTNSDFTIKTTKTVSTKPLVLPTEAGNRYSDLQYTTAKWGKTNAAPHVVSENDLSKRVLPFDGSVGEFLVTSDFLEDYVVRVPHSLNRENYFDGNIKIDEGELSYLLPVKPLLFEYFTVDEFQGRMPDGKPMFEMCTLAGNSGVKATLRVPIEGSGNVKYVEYSKLYYNESGIDPENNKGSIVELKFTGFIMPLIKFSNDKNAIYNVSCVQPTSARVEFTFYSGSKVVNVTSKSCRNFDGQILIKSDNYLLSGFGFDYVQVNNVHSSAIIIPKFKSQQSTERFEFAIDLGTSNTHIEYRMGNEKPEVFSFSKKDRQLCEMFTPTVNEFGALEDLIEETEMIEKDFVPSEIGNGDYQFPTRTVLSCSKNIDWKDVVEPFTLINLPFTYDKRSELSYNNFKYNIKWGKGDEMRVMESYIHCIMLIIRNKVLLNNGDLQRTKITWFYPISMAVKRLTKLRATWNEAYEKYFGAGSTLSMTESSAPIQYFFKRYSTATNLVNVDIGGGTTDIAFASDKKIQYVTSFRFASNALFEDSFSELNENNGIVDWHKNEILKILEEKNLSELVRIFNSPNNSHPANMASFLFGLKDNTIPKRAGVNSKAIDFNYLLQEDENFKIVFIVFYTSIVYHIAQIVKQFNLNVPRHISFSGNGSKVINVITSDSKTLANYTKLVFEKVLGRPYNQELELLGLDKDSNPKESTCKGGIIGTEDDGDQIKPIVFKSDCTGIIQQDDIYSTIDADYKRRTVNAVEKFFKFVLEDMNRDFNFDKNFGVKSSSIRIAQDIAKKDLAIFLDKGINERKEEAEETSKIEETFFFYPIKGVIQAISTEIYNKLNGD